ncbi:MAG: class I SAM-dependent methyltransferase [bacterium]|nr:class I SAM-dependent methyltransferase [bacterium]
MPTLAEKTRLHEYADPIQGWASDPELHTLFDLAKACTGKGVIVEIGSWKGKSTVALGLGSEAGKNIRVFAIDPHTGSPDHLAKRGGEAIWTFDEFKKNMETAGLTNTVEPIRDFSDKVAHAWNKPIELLYLDVNYHAYEPGKEDFLTWSKLVIDGGTIALHNTYPALRVVIKEGQPFHGWPGPQQILRRFVLGKRGWRNIRIVDTTTIMEKTKESRSGDTLQGFYMRGYGETLLLAQKLYQLLTRMPVPVKKFLKRIVISGAKH